MSTLPGTRAHPRFEVNAVVDLVGGDQPHEHPVQNISLGGICIRNPTIEEVGTRVSLLIHFPDLGAPPLSLQGEVVWANHADPPDMGIRFVDLDEEKREILREFLRRVGARDQSAGRT